MRRNFDLLHTAVRRLGRVPEMLSADDFADGLDEPSVVLYVAHLCARLLEVRGGGVEGGRVRRWPERAYRSAVCRSPVRQASGGILEEEEGVKRVGDSSSL